MTVFHFIFSLFKFTPLSTSDVILALTGIIVWAYTVAAQHANELQTSPVLILSFIDTTQSTANQKNGKIIIKNIGKGPAYDIDLLPFIQKEQNGESYAYTFYVEERLLEAKQESELKKWVATSNGGVEFSDLQRFLFRLIPDTMFPIHHVRIQAWNPAVFVINYRGISGKRYHSIYRLYSVLPPVGDIVMQLLHQGRGSRGMLRARLNHFSTRPLSHEGNRNCKETSWILWPISLLHVIKTTITTKWHSYWANKKLIKRMRKNKVD
ncbi:MAG: hypothetical protein WCX46_03940 [Candidatus Paceibacterota bacterium]